MSPMRRVLFVVAFLERVYNAKSMAYGEYSDQVRKGETLTDDESTEIRDEINGWQNTERAVDFFRQAGVFKKSELIDVVGWEKQEAELNLRRLAAFRLVRPTREGFRKTPAFIALLRSLTGDTQLEYREDDDEPF